jgi:hypothetical protein
MLGFAAMHRLHFATFQVKGSATEIALNVLTVRRLRGGDEPDRTPLPRAGRTTRLLGGWIPAPSTLGTFLRAFTFGHVRQLDKLLGEALERAWKLGAVRVRTGW